MKDHSKAIAVGRNVILTEAQAVNELVSRIDESFARAVELIYDCAGQVIVTGVGKSGIIGRKIVATMNSTGTPAVFLHPSDAAHGDLGLVRKDDVVICISKSGATSEVAALLPMFKRLGVPIISMVGRLNSPLAQASTIVLNASVLEEACPHDLAPTSSTTVALVLGDALAVALLDRRQFSQEEFARYHPGGTLGKRLLLKVDELMIKGPGVPRVTADVSLADAIMEMTTKRLGCTCVVKADGVLEGIITDGDLRRLLQHTHDISSTTAGMAMTVRPKTVVQGTLAVLALEKMETYSITQMIVVNDHDCPVGVIHLHDLVKAGLGGDDRR